MSWKAVIATFEKLVKKRPKPPIWSQILGEDGDGILPSEPLRAGASYVSVTVCRMRLEYSRITYKTYYPVVQSYVEIARQGENEVTIPAIAGPEHLAAGGSRQASLVLVQDVQVLRPTPYIGGPISVAVGLFATQANDYLKNLISILGSVSGVIGGASLTTALNVVEPLKSGVEAFFGLNEDVSLQVGIETTFGTPMTGYYVVVDDPDLPTDSRFRYRSGELFVVSSNGALVPVQASHVVFRIDHQQSLDEYTQIPALYKRYQALTTAAINNGLDSDDYKEALGAFKVEVSGNADLVDDDRIAIIAAAAERAKQYAGGAAPVDTHADEDKDAELRDLVQFGRTL